jgi:hypothetical protein
MTVRRLFYLVVSLWVALGLGRAMADDVPYFAGEPQFPNVMIIFDNSDSMQDVPYTNPGGVAVRPSGQQWQKDVMDQYGNPYRDASGNLVWTVRPDRASDPDATKLASGGDHPASKLYQAKEALNKVLDGLTVGEDYRGGVNLGFATYMSDRVPQVRAKYYQIYPAVPGTTTDDPIRWEVLEKKTSATSWSTNVTSTNATSFSWCSRTITGSVGTKFKVPRTCIQGSPPSAISGKTCDLRNEEVELTITNVVPEYKDGVIYQYRWYFGGSYIQYGLRTYTDASDTYDPSITPSATWYDKYPATGGPNNLPAPPSGWTRVTNAPGCQVWRKYDPPPQTTGAQPKRYGTTWITTTGNWSASAGSGGYIDPVTLKVTPAPTYPPWTLVPEGGLEGYECKQTGGSTIWCVPPDEPGPPACNRTGKRCDIAPARYRYDYFRYPGYGTPDRPHAWSYVRRSGTPSGSASGTPWGTWGESGQPNPFFPGSEGKENANLSGDDHVVFVNLPLAGTNDWNLDKKNEIRRFISLDRWKANPENTNYVYTTMPYTTSLAPNSTQVASWPGTAGGKATPLAATLRWAKKYFESYIQQDAPSRDNCRKNFVLLLTDGLDTCDCDPTLGYEVCRAPITAAEELKSVMPGNKGPYTLVVGFGLDPAQADNLNEIAKAGWPDDEAYFVSRTPGAFFASNVNELTEILNQLFSGIGSGTFTRSDMSMSRQGDRLYLSYFDYGASSGWAGHLAKFKINRDGSVGDPVEQWGGNGDAGASINGQPSRNLFTSILGTGGNFANTSMDSGLTPFSTGQAATLKAYLLSSTDDIDGNGTPYEISDAETVISFVHDPGFDGGRYRGKRRADWKLADIYHSRPLVVGRPNMGYPATDYQSFVLENATRRSIVYVGSNGGMLHAIKDRYYDEGGVLKDDDGTELWAYIPKMALANLKDLRQVHKFFVDSSPVAFDMKATGASGTVFPGMAGWRTVLISGMRDGGRGYFALDITNPEAPRVLWEYTDDNGENNMGYTWSMPAVGRIKLRVGGNVEDRWVAFVGGGWMPQLSGNENRGNRLYIIDIERGTLLTSGGLVAEYVIGDAFNRVPSAIRAVDMDDDYYVETIYFGDTSGNLWKMDLRNPDMSTWAPCKLFDPSNPNWNTATAQNERPAITPRPIYYPPAVALAEDGKNLVLFGTGDENDPLSLTTQDYFYEVKDLGSCPGTINWVKALPQGQKVLARPVYYNYIVWFTTYSPEGECGRGRGYLYGLKVSRGDDAQSLGGQAGIELGTGEVVESKYIGTGVPSSPLVTNENVYTVTSSLPSSFPADIGAELEEKRTPHTGVVAAVRGWGVVMY